MACSRLLFGRFSNEVAVSLKINFFFCTDIQLERTETSAEKPGRFAVRQVSKIIRMKIIETEKEEEDASRKQSV